VKLTYDKRLRVGYIQFKKTRIAKTVKFRSNLLIDMNKKGEIVGIELLELAGLPKVKSRPSTGRSASRSRKKAAA
jgi:uncharacterized protein YuzE